MSLHAGGISGDDKRCGTGKGWERDEEDEDGEVSACGEQGGDKGG